MPHTQTVSLDLGDILRKRIDECAKWKRDVEIPKDLLQKLDKILAKEGELLEKLSELSEEEDKLLRDAFFSISLGLFLEAKEKFVIPEAVISSLQVKFFLQIREPIELTLAYQDFYACQFCDMLDDIVRRAFLIRDVFSKRDVPDQVKLACSEAYRCFLYGFNTAAITLCRGILEAALKLGLQVDVGPLGSLNERAKREGKISSETFRKINNVNRLANKCLHEISRGKEPSEKETLRVIGLTQESVQALPPPDDSQGPPK